jgi:hypothetical protein
MSPENEVTKLLDESTKRKLDARSETIEASITVGEEDESEDAQSADGFSCTANETNKHISKSEQDMNSKLANALRYIQKNQAEGILANTVQCRLHHD